MEKVKVGLTVHRCLPVFFLWFHLLQSSVVALEMEAEDGTNSRDPLTSEPGDPVPQKKKKKKRTPTTGRFHVGSGLFVQSPKVACLCGLDQDTDNPEVPNGTTEEPALDGEELQEAATRKTRRKRWVLADNVDRWWC